MTLTNMIAHGVHQIPLGFVNTYLIETPDFLILVDTGFPRSTEKILDAVRELGHSPTDIAHILLTHAHPDHVGSAAELVRKTGAQTWIHELDVVAVENATLPSVHPAPGFLPKLLFTAMKFLPQATEPTKIDNVLHDEDILPFDDLQAFHAPGHCTGQVVLLSHKRRLLFAADSCMNLRGLRAPLVNEDEVTGLKSLRRISGLSFEIACFGHGKTIYEDADKAFRKDFW